MSNNTSDALRSLALAISELEADRARAWARVQELEALLGLSKKEAREQESGATPSGAQLRAWRYGKGFSLVQAAVETGVSPETLRAAEAGNAVRGQIAAKILIVTGVRLPVVPSTKPEEPLALNAASAAIRAWYKERGMTREQASAAIGCSDMTIRNVEKGKHVTPVMGTLILAATGIEVPVADKRKKGTS